MIDSTPDRPAANTSSPVLVLLPGLDGTGKLFAEFLRVLDLNISTLVVAYPKDIPKMRLNLLSILAEAKFARSIFGRHRTLERVKLKAS